MRKPPQPYVRIGKVGGNLVITVMKRQGNGHVPAAQGVCLASDSAAVYAEVVRCMDDARAGSPLWEKQADGNS